MDKMEQLSILKEQLALGGGQKQIDNQHAKGKRTARERINLLFDEGSFVEMNAFIKHRCVDFGMEQKEASGDGVITGYGRVNGKTVYVYAQDFTVIGGTVGEMHAKKITKVQECAIKNGAPIVGLMDSGGARIQEGIDALNGFGEIFRNNTLASGVIPQISAIMGPCAGGAVYSPAITDFVFMVEETAHMFITGPEVIKTVTGEEVTFEALGGAHVHSAVSGVAHFSAQSDEECIHQIRKLLTYLPQNNAQASEIINVNDDLNRDIPELNTIIPEKANAAYNMYDIIQKIVDDGDYLEVQPAFAKNVITCFARIGGRAVGIVANSPMTAAGCLDANASDKAARFIRNCDAFHIPIITLVDVPGFLPGTQQEHSGVIRHGAKLLFAYSEATVPKISIITRKAYGGAYIAMCSKSVGADEALAWPSAEIAVMGAAGAANIVFKKEINAAEDPSQKRVEKVAEYQERFATPYVAASRGYIDDVIEPAQTRIRLIAALQVNETKREKLPAKKHSNIPL